MTWATRHHAEASAHRVAGSFEGSLEGLTRSRTDKLVVMPCGADARATGTKSRGSGGNTRGSNVTSLASAGGTEGSAAPKVDAHLALEQMPWTTPTKAPDARAQVAERRAEANARGYEGEACPECMNFTLMRNGTCMKCEYVRKHDGVFVSAR